MFNIDIAKECAEKLKVDWNKVKYTPESLLKGMNVELEHGTRHPDLDLTGDDPLKTAKVALAHLRELPDYYERLEKYVETKSNPINEFLQGC
jgi:hypothetical protein